MADRPATRLTLSRLLGGRTGFAVVVALLNVLVTSLVVIAVRWPPPGAVRIEVATAASADTVTVLVGGQVSRPGVYTLDEAATVGEAIAAAGGLLPDATAVGMDTSAAVRDGQQVWVGASASSTIGAGSRIDINSASAEELDALPGIGPTLASRVIAYREEHGPFSTVEELLNVSGIGEATLAAIRSQVEVR